MFLYGKNSSLERIRNNPKSIRKIYLDNNFDDFAILKEIKNKKIPTQYLSDKKMQKIKASSNLQGIVAEIEPFKYTDFDDLIFDETNKPTLIFLDRIFDPQNLGAILRTTACLGGFAVVIPKHRACPVTDTVLRIASGGENFTPVSLIGNISQSLLQAKKCGYWIAGTLLDQADPISKVKLPTPLGIVIGSEGTGIREGLKKHIDMNVTIPMGGAPLSLNVATATAVICYEVMRQKSSD